MTLTTRKTCSRTYFQSSKGMNYQNKPENSCFRVQKLKFIKNISNDKSGNEKFKKTIWVFLCENVLLIIFYNASIIRDYQLSHENLNSASKVA